MTDEFRIASILQTVEILRLQIEEARTAGLIVCVPEMIGDYLQGTRDDYLCRWHISRPYNTKVLLGTLGKSA